MIDMQNLFIHLRVHSNYSLAEGMLSFDYLSNFCVNNNQPAIAITDTSNMFGVLEFSQKMISAGVQPIIGIQVNISEKEDSDENIGEVVLIAKNGEGYKNLLILASDLYLSKKFDKYVPFNKLEKHNKGLMVLTGGVENGFVGRPASENNRNKVKDRLLMLSKLFRDNLYIELQRHGLSNQDIAEDILLNFADKLNLPLVATNDCFFENENKFNSHQ
ncbi:MAG: PHP domain-containing protein, partial [Alphaproteobacteria bacterium]|nr:PHP domain-containing protein [Alphaproteobacteria bacterium]